MSDELTESPPRAGMDCFRNAIEHGTDEAVRRAASIRFPKLAEREEVLRLMQARRRLLELVTIIEREEQQP